MPGLRRAGLRRPRGRVVLVLATVGAEEKGRRGVKTIEERVRDVIERELGFTYGVTPDQVTRESRFVEDLGADSLDTVELVMAIEEEFQVEIDDETAEGWSTVGDVIEYLERNGATL